MTTPIKTQCPHCQACFNVKQTQLNKVNATINCEQCQRRFLVNKHLIVTSDTLEDATAQTETFDNHAQPKTPQSKDFPSDTLIHDDLIYDDMDIDESEEADLEYDSLDSMEAWLNQASMNATTPSVLSEDRPTISEKTTPSLVKPASHARTDLLSSTQVALSSAAANDIRANVGDATDNSWLEDLLKEQKIEQEAEQDDKDLSQLLREMGVPSKDERNTSKEHIKKSEASFASTPERRSIASLLWALGCLVLALLLFAQYIIFNLDTLVKNPAHAERLQAICALAACSLPSAELNAFTITDSSHKPSQINKNGQFSDISATLRNQSATAQLYPHIKVSVYGADNLIGTFIAAPDEYLLSKQHQLAANRGRKLLFTIPVANAQIREVIVKPIY